MRITYFARDNGACAYYRVILPFETAHKYKSCLAYKIEKGDDAKHIQDGLIADVFAIPRIKDQMFLDMAKQLQGEGKKIVIDHDDNLFNISPYSPHYKDFGLEEVKHQMPSGELLDLWIDGKTINISENIQRLDFLKKAVEMADMVTVTTPILADIYKQYNDNVVVLPNCVNASLWQKLPIKNEEIKLYWSGGYSHYEDWILLKDVLPDIMNKYPQTKLVLMGCKFDGILKGLSQDRIEYHPWVHTMAYPYKTIILNPDICIIPLVDNEFNRCKSAIKFIEMGALGVPCVMSNVSPYKEMQLYSPDNAVYVDNDTDAWIAGISLLIEDSILRSKIAGEANRTVSNNFDINTRHIEWVNEYSNLCGGIA